ncbi:trehalase [Cryptotermes secundus]|nr:trehalase [Cryptotermes secundus]
MVVLADADIILCAVTICFLGAAVAEYQQPCNSPIYCYGDLLKTVQLSDIYNDSKTFVDKKQRQPPTETLQLFEDFMAQTGGNPDRDQVIEFVERTFVEGNELQPWVPGDWVENPAILQKIADPDLREWARDLNVLWKNLSRKMSDDVHEHPDEYSIIYVPNGFVIPGGRFREFYYWDTYWIIQGLLLSEMYHTTRGILENFLSMVEKYGFVPNGGRVYYVQRSQPPLLIPMVHSYVTQTSNITFLRNNINLLEAEFQFWMTNRTVTVNKQGKEYRLARYYAATQGPRPESYSEDYHNAEFFPTEKEKEDFYINIKSAAESGWDFSSRWFIANGTNAGDLLNIQTENIIPVDLNSFLFWDAVLLAKFYEKLGNLEKSQHYHNVAEQWKAAVTAVHWNEKVGTWLDYDILNNKSREYFYPSNLAPLWTQCYDEAFSEYYAHKTVQYISDETIRSYLGGIPTSLELTDEQWDLPNAWPPLQIIVIQGLLYTKDPGANNLAYELARNWIYANHKGYLDAKEMFEKYDAEYPGKYGGGGEYTVQSGFGWTNGVIMELLNTYGLNLTSAKNRRTHYLKRGWLTPYYR